MFALLVVALMVGALADPAFTARSVANSLQICARSIVPALFVYMVLSDWLIKSGTLRNMGKIFAKPGNAFGIGGEGITVFLIGLFCGFPVGARLSAELYSRGEIEKSGAEYLNIISNNASLPFIFGVVGSIFERRGAWIVFLSQFIGAIINAVIFKYFFDIKKQKATIATVTKTKYKFTESVTNTGIAMIGICASVAFFGFLGDIAEEFANYFPALKNLPLKGIFEFSSGVIKCEHLNSSVALPAAAFFCCFGGFSVFGQVKTVLNSKLDGKFYLPAKVLHGIFGMFLAIILSRIM